MIYFGIGSAVLAALNGFGALYYALNENWFPFAVMLASFTLLGSMVQLKVFG